MSDSQTTSSKKSPSARVTLRVSESELERLKELAESRGVDLTSVIREAIGAYLSREREGEAHRAEHEKLGEDLAATVKREADRVIERQEQITRALIDALNEQLGKP